MVDQECLSSYFQLYGRKRLSPGNGKRALLLYNIFSKEDPANYRSITLLSVVGKVVCKILNNRLVPCLDKGALYEEKVGFRIIKSCMGNVYTLN